METFPEFDSNNRLETVKRFEKMLKSDEVEFLEVSAFEYLIEHYLEKQNFSMALTAAKIGYKQYPYSIDILKDIASILIETGRINEAMAYIEKAEVLSPSDADVLMLKGVTFLDLENFDGAISCFEKLLMYPEGIAEVYYHLGMAYFGKEDSETSIEYFKKSIQSNPQNEEAIFELVNVLDTLDMLEETIPFYQELIDDDPYSYVSWFNLGIVYDRLGKYDEAISAYEYAITIKEDFASAYYNLACTYMAMERFSNAIDTFGQALDYEDWKDVAIFLNIAHCYYELGNDKESVKQYHKVLKLDQENYLAYFGIGRCLERQENWMESVHFLNKAIKYFPSDINVWLLLAKAEYNLGNLISSITAFIKASELEPEIPEIWLDWSFIVSEQGDYMKALQIIDLGIDALPEEASLYYRAVVYLIKESKYKEAFLYLENALTLNFEKHAELFEFFPELETQKALMKIIDQFSEGDVR